MLSDFISFDPVTFSFDQIVFSFNLVIFSFDQVERIKGGIFTTYYR